MRHMRLFKIPNVCLFSFNLQLEEIHPSVPLAGLFAASIDPSEVELVFAEGIWGVRLILVRGWIGKPNPRFGLPIKPLCLPFSGPL